MRNLLRKLKKKQTFLGKVFTQKRLSQKLKTVFLKKFYLSNQTSWGSHVERGWVSYVNSRHRPLQLTSRMLSRAVSSVLAIKANPKHRLSNLSILLLFFWPVFWSCFLPITIWVFNLSNHFHRLQKLRTNWMAFLFENSTYFCVSVKRISRNELWN